MGGARGAARGRTGGPLSRPRVRRRPRTTADRSDEASCAGHHPVDLDAADRRVHEEPDRTTTARPLDRIVDRHVHTPPGPSAHVDPVVLPPPDRGDRIVSDADIAGHCEVRTRWDEDLELAGADLGGDRGRIRSRWKVREMELE